MKYYLIQGDEIILELERARGDVTALPVLDEANAVSLMNEKHFKALQDKMKWSEEDTVKNLGLVEKRPDKLEAELIP